MCFICWNNYLFVFLVYFMVNFFDGFGFLVLYVMLLYLLDDKYCFRKFWIYIIFLFRFCFNIYICLFFNVVLDVLILNLNFLVVRYLLELVIRFVFYCSLVGLCLLILLVLDIVFFFLWLGFVVLVFLI